MLLNRKDAETLFKFHPDYSSVQVEIHDKSEEWRQALSEEYAILRSKARAEAMYSLFDIRAAAYLRLVDNMEYHEAYCIILADAVQQIWGLYAKAPPEIFERAAGADQGFVTDLRARERHWKVEGFRRVAAAEEAKKLAKPLSNPGALDTLRPLSEILDGIVLQEDISHEELAHRIGISRAAYFLVKAGRGGRKVRRKTQSYVDRLFSST